jgi:hypothetical protein
VLVGRQQRQRVTHVELSQQGVNRSDLQAGAATSVAQFGGVDMILSVGIEKR